jgi:hypothetical protein
MSQHKRKGGKEGGGIHFYRNKQKPLKNLAKICFGKK